MKVSCVSLENGGYLGGAQYLIRTDDLLLTSWSYNSPVLETLRNLQWRKVFTLPEKAVALPTEL